MLCPHCKSELPADFKFCGNCGQKVDAILVPQVTSIPTPPPAKRDPLDERREVAVLFADVKGYTSMSERLDPEEVHEIMNECFSGLGAAIHAEGGHIDKYIGDNIMALFGAPIAHEDDPSRACRAAIAMQEFLQGFASEYQPKIQTQLQMRIGINWGLVVSGLIGSREVRQDYSVMGDTVNLAARLESAAEPGSILVSRTLAERTQGRFSFAPYVEINVKGKSEPIQACTLLTELSEIDQRGRDGFSVEFVGREKELQELRGTLSSHQALFENRWIEIRGPLGVGKTRLFEQAADAFHETTCIKVIGTAISLRRPFGLARRLIHEVLKLVGSGQSLPTSRSEFARLLAPLGSSLNFFIDALWFIAPPSQISVENPEPDPETLRAMVEQGITTLIQCLSLKFPRIIFIIDSFELADEESAHLLATLSLRDWQKRILFLITSRPESFEQSSVCKTFWIDPLDPLQSEELLSALARNARLPLWLRRDLLKRAAGNPLFLEELVRVLVQQKILVAKEASTDWYCTIPEHSPECLDIELPSSIRGAMLTRLDALDPELREFICQAAIQGNEFHLDVIDHIRQSAELSASAPHLERLIELEFVRENTIAQRKRYCFLQPVMQESCYLTLLLKRRKELHLKTAEALIALLGSEETVSPEILAYHYENSEQWSKASRAHLRHAEYAQELFLNREALQSFAAALRCLERIQLSEAEEFLLRDRALRGTSRIHLHTGNYQDALVSAAQLESIGDSISYQGEGLRLQARAHLHLGEKGRAIELLTAAHSRLKNAEDYDEHLFLAAHDLADLHQRNNEHATALEWIVECRALLSEEDYLSQIKTDLLHGQIKHSKGEFEEAFTLYTSANQLAKQHGTISEQARALNCLGNVERDLGHYDRASTYFNQALTFWTKTENTRCIAGVQNNLGNLAMSRGDYPTAFSHQEKAFLACKKIGDVHGAAMARANLAYLALEQNRAEEAVACATDALDILKDSGEWLRALIEVVLGEALLALPDIESAHPIFMRVIERVDDASHPLALAGALRGVGKIECQKKNWVVAGEYIDRALLLFEKLKRQQELGRTLLVKANILASLGEPEQGLELFKKAHAIFTEIRAVNDSERAQVGMRTLDK